jgi:hypothetical protein
MINAWDQRYATHPTVYGTLPNVFMASQLALRTPGTIYLPCDGEGRNGVWAAEQGWRVSTFDASEVGIQKSRALADQRGVEIHAMVGDAMTVDPREQFDVVALVFAHMPPLVRGDFHRRAWSWVKPGGLLLVEGFHKDQLGLTSGGPRDIDMLFSETTLPEDLGDDALVQWCARCEQVLDEGPFHQGFGVTCQWIIRKPNA